MSSKIKKIDLKIFRYYLFDDMINIKTFDLNKIKIDEKQQKKIFTYYVRYMTVNSVNPLYLLSINNMNRYSEIKTMEINIRNQFLPKISRNMGQNQRSYQINNNSDNYDEKYMKTKFNSEDDPPLNKTLKLYNMVKVVRFVFHKGNEYYP